MSWLHSDLIPPSSRASGAVPFNASGDSVPAPSDSPGDADALSRGFAAATACTVLTPGDCLMP
jgi:hypothetical protein